MIRQNFDRQWGFTFGEQTQTVDLPHDFSIAQRITPDAPSGSSNGYFPGGIGDYEKKFVAPEQWRGKRIYLEFEGAYMHATVRVNRNIVAQHAYGYTSFHCELTPYLRIGGENTVTVRVNNGALPNCRWYSGSGIYRHVWLMAAEPVHIAPCGVFVSTPDNAAAEIETTVENCGGDAGQYILRSSVLSSEGAPVASEETGFGVAGESAVVRQSIPMPNATLWSLDNPYLYKLRTELLRGGEVLDTAQTAFGVRTIAVDAVRGFRLNGETVNLKGGCVHHDCGLLGAAAHDRAEERKVELLKANGFNAVRCAHNPPSPAFLDACDRLGVAVIDEAFDCWRESKMTFDYSLLFSAHWQEDMASMVLRDRNHPSVVMWSIGNEIPERDGRSDGYAIARELADYVRSLDTTRPVTNALCGLGRDAQPDPSTDDLWGKLTEKFAEPLDVVGYNYQMDRLESDGKKYPNRVIVGTETFARDIFDGWAAVEALPHVIGDFVWTSLDYLGEAGIGHVWYNGEGTFSGAYPWNQAFCGDIDVCGFKRPQSYYRDFVWGLGTVPYIAVYKPEFYGKEADVSPWGWPDVAHSWSWPGAQGKPIQLEIYSGGDEIELLLNGKSLGRKPAGKAAKYLAKFETAYEPGELIAVTYENGEEKSRSVLKTAGAPASIRLTPDKTALDAAARGLSFVGVELLDKDGNVVTCTDNEIVFEVVGPGSILAVGNGNPKSEEPYVGDRRRIHEGRAMAVVQATGEPGRITLRAAAVFVPAAEAVIEAN